ncbi:BT_3987 domain-containing protein [Sphingobacterium suaedae]|uniref:BT_3987 domain-containing protein n=1 Tax=Sphingobacterium suaedae TaxID=1686402 RepID=A0ABW5KEN1_9SPHI
MKRYVNQLRTSVVRRMGWMILVCTMVSCSTDDMSAPQDLIIYMPAGATYNTADASYVTARSTVLAGAGTAFPVLLTRAFDQEVQVTATIDTSLLSAYDLANKTQSPVFPAGAFVLENNGQVRIPAGQERSVDSLRITLGEAGELDFSKQYVVPIRLASTNSSLPLSSNRQVMYLRVTFNRITTQLNGVPANRIVPIVINRTPTGDVVSGQLNLTAGVNTAFGQALTVALRERPDLLARYNEMNQTTYAAFPANSFAVSPASVSIASGNLNAAAPFAIALQNTSAFVPGRSYLLPFGIADEGPVPPHEALGQAYVAVEVQLQNINPANPAPTGSRVGRAGWAATASSTDNSYASGAPALAFDGDAATGWHSALAFGTPPAVTFTVDMQSQKNIRGFTFTPRYWNYFSSSYISAVTGMRVASSNDGTNWTIQGSYMGSMPGGTAANPELRNVSFYAPVQARYFRFTLTAYGQYAAGFGELNAFE